MDSSLVFSSMDTITESLSKGEVILVSSKNGESPNPMVIGWGGINYIWKKLCFVVMVRSSRFSHHLINEYDDFSINIMNKNDHEALKICGSVSGRNENKFSILNTPLLKPKSINTPVIGNAKLKIECKKLCKLEMNEILTDISLINQFYDTSVKKANALHDFYIGEIIEIYE